MVRWKALSLSRLHRQLLLLWQLQAMWLRLLQLLSRQVLLLLLGLCFTRFLSLLWVLS